MFAYEWEILIIDDEDVQPPNHASNTSKHPLIEKRG
jgi:hypothetical protein